MDRVHEADKRPWISQSKFKIDYLARERSKLLREHGITLDGSAPAESLPADQADNLTQKLRTFVANDEEQVKPYFLFNATDERVLVDAPECELKLYQLQLEHAKRMISDRAYKVGYLSKLRTTRRESLMRHLALVDRSHEPQDNQQVDLSSRPSEDSLVVIVVVQVWPQPKKTEKLKMEREIMFRADQFLTDLRDRLKCQNDYGVPMDLSDNPEQQDERVFRGELFKSGFFLIEDTFYNDMRDVSNRDMSQSIIEWAAEEVTMMDEDNRNVKVSRGIGPFKGARMEQTRFENLTVRLGYPYLYLHQGNCEHLFTISDIRYVQSGPQLSQMRFPFVTAVGFDRNQDSLKCYMCRHRPPHWYTRNNDRLPVDPFFFCESCFMSFNYDSDKKKIGSFQAYLYTCTSGIPDSILISSSAGGGGGATGTPFR